MKIKNILVGIAATVGLVLISLFLMKTFMPAMFSSGFVETSKRELFITACIFAPLWEEAVWRYAPIEILRNLTDFEKIKWPFIIGSGLLFGYWHYGPASVPIQGVAGMVFAWVYIENKFSYLSSVIVHSLWNFSLIVAMPYLINSQS